VSAIENAKITTGSKEGTTRLFLELAFFICMEVFIE
jgi:hypothetical protein